MARAGKHPKEMCNLCHREISVQYLTTHRRRMHGIRGGQSGRVRRNHREMALEHADTQTAHLSPAVMSNPELTRWAEESLQDRQNGARRMIRVLPEYQVVTDGKRIGILEWIGEQR